jgi:hypothetical protein
MGFRKIISCATGRGKSSSKQGARGAGRGLKTKRVPLADAALKRLSSTVVPAVSATASFARSAELKVEESGNL